MKNYTSTEPVFSESIPVVEEDDLVNAENNNAAAIQLLQNILVLAAAKVDKEEGKSLVSDTERNLWNMIYQNATGYTDQKIADLIGGAPSTLDTLGEIAKAMADNADVVEALNTAIGSKANQVEMESLFGTKLDKAGDSKDNTITFTSSDTTTPSAWTDVAVLKSGETHKSFVQKVSTMFKNLRYLWKILGSTSLTGIGDGTVTGAINALNTGIVKILDPSDFITTINDGKITLYMHPWRPNGFYAVYIAQNGTNIWLMLGTLVWNFNVFHTDAGNSSANNIAITGDQGVGITITITNGIIKKDGKFEFIIKGLVVR